MSTINDLFNAALADLGYSGNINDRLHEFFTDEGCDGSLRDQWPCWLAKQGFATGSENDQLYAYLEDLGHSGSLNDMLKASLIDGSFFGPFGGGILLENGVDFLLTETDDYLIQE